jgi:hypothetical protein
VITAAPFGDIVQQCREVERAARLDRRHDLGRDRQFLFQLAGLDLVQDADREQRVLVDGIDMVHVVLHLRDDAAEIRDKASEHAGFVHASQRSFRILP